jgi:hypothetical protein
MISTSSASSRVGFGLFLEPFGVILFSLPLPLPGSCKATRFSLPAGPRSLRLMKGGGVYLNNAEVGEELYSVKGSDLIDGRLLLVAAGKKNKMLVRVVD